METRIITDRCIFDDFVTKHAYCHYMKTSMYGEYRSKANKDKYVMLGFYEQNELKATALVLSNRKYGYKYLYIPKGPCLDYSDASLLEAVICSLKKYADDMVVSFMRIDPNVVRNHHDIKGNIIDDGYNMECVTEQLKSMGFRHRGYGYAYDGSWTNRYTLIIDIAKDIKDIKKGFTSPRRTSINRHEIYGITTEFASVNDLDDLMLYEKQLSEEDGFKPHTKKFFLNWLDSFKDNAVFYKTTISFKDMIDKLSLEVNAKKYAKDPEAKAAVEKNLTYAEECLAQYGDHNVLACGIFIRIAGMSWDLYTYNDKRFIPLKAVDNLHWFAIRDMKEHGVTQYDMCGFSGVVDRSDPEFGLYQYKSSFGSEYIEQIGEFDYIRDAKAMIRFNRAKRIENGLRRRWVKYRYQKSK